jgi:two-component system sensor histidine kinase RegB
MAMIYPKTHFRGSSDRAASVSARALTFTWLVRLRWGSALAQAATVLLAIFALHVPLATSSLALVIALTATTNVALYLWDRAERPIGPYTIGAVLVADTVLLTTLLYFSGGPSNPFSSLYLVYVTLAALALGMRWASAVVGTAAAGYALLFHAHVSVAMLEHEHHGGSGVSTHLQAMWVAFTVTATLIAYFVSRVAHALRERDAQLAEAQRTADRNEKLVSLSTLAAGAAHELGTPLSTIAVAANELERALTRGGLSLTDDTRLIRAAVERCKAIVTQMSGRSADGTGEVRERASIQDIVDELCARAAITLPARVAVEIDPAVPERVAVPRGGLVQALTCLLRNALDASPKDARVSLHVLLAEDRLRFDVKDEGTGITTDVLSRLGEPFFTTKPPGRGTGLGVFLARAFAERWQGHLAIDSTLGRGTRATLEIRMVREASEP